ncbi:MAG: M6 family metalloprotease domain-containing protein [Bacteroidales bacterium]|nr:M6 family metalloprotease domain-containing protein [Bacteroidales bacterium]MBR6931656.1 M6 family metalloprotease domain-containing protein [Bacteroidales bacterium]
MKRIIVFWFILLMTCFGIGNAHAAYLRNIPVTVTQPDGTVLHCFASGDEFFNYLHDGNGYTIIQHPQTGYYVYAEKQDGSLVATEFIAGRQDPARKGLKPYALISPQEWMAKRKAWDVPDERPQNRDYTPNHGTLNNISIFIRFSDDGQFTNSYSSIDNMFNDVSEGAVSMRSYFRSASYGAIEIPTTFYPGHNGESIISYQDNYPRSYFQPYNASTNTNGYQNEGERTNREFSLLQRAVNYVNANFPVPTNLNIDYDSDGYVDNVCFIVKGDVGDWSSMLWPHKWALYDRTVNINGKRVWTYNFQLADASGYFNTSTMCHEMNHSLGAPDLYHYSYSGPDPVGPWDLMDDNAMPPQHCGAYMKMKYGHWIEEIPEITQSGTYTLHPISSSTPTNVAYKIATAEPNQFYVLEYRNANMPFESALPGSGLLIYRIDTRFDGNRDYDPTNGIYDEIYIFRPNGTTSVNGDLYRAHFSSSVSRTEFSSSTNPYPFFSEGTIDNNIRIYNVTNAGNTISFSVQMSNSGHTITATATPSIGGTVSGGGTFNSGATCTLTATPSEGYAFVNWTENGNVISTNSSFSFNVSGDRNLVANFSLSENHWTPEGANYSGVMSVYSVIQINGIEQYSNQLEVGAFCGDECRGTAIASEFFLTHRYLAIMTIYGETGHQLTFKLYDHCRGDELELASPAAIMFNDDGYGTPVDPYNLNYTGQMPTVFHFATDGNWSEASNWCGNALPSVEDEVRIDANCIMDMNVEVSALTVSDGQSLTLQSGKTLNVTDNLTNSVAAGLVIEDGAQLIHNVANVQATVRKHITPFIGSDDSWHLIALPLTGSSNVASVSNLLEGEYDLYGYDEATTYWKNRKTTGSGFTVLQATKGYLYANGEEVTLGFSGTLENGSAIITVPLSFTDGAHLSGFNLIGNPFPCNAYIDREYFVLTSDGTDINPEPIPATTPIPPCTAVFVKAIAEGETVVFTRVAP